MNDNGDIAIWATTNRQKEILILKRNNAPAEIIAHTSSSGYESLGRPSINDSGEIAFWAGKENGLSAIVRYDGNTLQEVVNQEDSDFSLRYPEIANNGDIVYMHMVKNGPGAGRRQISVRKSNSTVEVFTEAGFYPGNGSDFSLRGTLYSLYGAIYDIAPNGHVAFNYYLWADAQISYWNGSTVNTFNSQEGVVHLIRFGSTNNYITARTFRGEDVRQHRISVPTGNFLIIAHEQGGPYGGMRAATFAGGSPNDAGDAIISVVVKVSGNNSLNDKRSRGYQLWFYDNSSPNLPDVIAAPENVIDGRVINNINFLDSFNNSGEIAFTAEIETSKVQHHALVVHNYTFDAVPVLNNTSKSHGTFSPSQSVHKVVGDSFTLPDKYLNRLISIRAFNLSGRLVGEKLVRGSREINIKRMFESNQSLYLLDIRTVEEGHEMVKNES